MKLTNYFKRIPGYTDRILYYQAPYYKGIMEPEKLDASNFSHLAKIYKKNKIYHNYSDYCEKLTFSDHSPVFATFKIHVPTYWWVI